MSDAPNADRSTEEPPADTAASSDLGLAFVGTYPPRRCGIATFTSDLAQAIRAADARVRPMIIALTDTGGQYAYPEAVKYEIRQGSRGDYARAAELVNYSDVKLVSLQHEHGIFGGDDGVYVLDFLTALRVPVIATLHTVLKNPSDAQRHIIQRMYRHCAGLVVMSKVASDLLASAYGLSGPKIHVIAHGIPEMRPRDQEHLKSRFGVGGRRMLLTFGLLGPGKGIETVIRALPDAIAAFPDLMYFVVGATHPTIVRRHGEAYRTTLEREAERLGVREHVVFRDQFVSTEELCRYLQAADIFISPYVNEAQVTSGALSYAMGAGAAIISTPYWHAQELLAGGRGRLFPFGDSAALGEAIGSLLSEPAELQRLRAAALDSARDMLWPRIAEAYLAVTSVAIRQDPVVPLAPRCRRASSLPELRLDHLLRLTDDTGIIQHASYSVPSRRSGYCVDDNARALIVALQADRLNSSAETRRLVSTYLGFLHFAQSDSGTFRNFMTYDRSFEGTPSSEDCTGRALWALGSTSRLAADDGCRLLACQMLERALPATRGMGPRGSALGMLGLASFLEAEPAHRGAIEAMETLSERLITRYQDEATDDWRWFESSLTYDNAILPLALFKAYAVSGDRSRLRTARASLEFLEEVCLREDTLMLVGNAGWHSRGGQRPVADEQPIDAAALVLAFRGAYQATGDHHYLRRMRQSFAWFLGVNRLRVSLYDFSTAGCRDGLGSTEVNQNQGAESTLCFLLSLLAMLELADEGLEHAASSSGEN
jgi:glycosyltransferase involved in cell wall biosynthesis